MNITLLVTFITELSVLIGVVAPLFKSVSKIKNGTRCQLRSEMLRIYYHNDDRKEIRQYEFENFVALYEAYKALGGNSFIDKIYKDIQSWKIISH